MENEAVLCRIQVLQVFVCSQDPLIRILTPLFHQSPPPTSVPLPHVLFSTSTLQTPFRSPAPPISTPCHLLCPLTCVWVAGSGGCFPLCQVAAPLWERALCAWTARDHPCLPTRYPAPAARCSLPGASGPGPPLSRLRPSLHVFSLGASAPQSVPLPPPPRLRLPPLRASSPAGRTGSEARRCARCRAGGRRAWAEPGAGTGGGGWEPRPEPERLLRRLRGGDLGEGGGKVWSRRRRRGLKSRAPSWGPR